MDRCANECSKEQRSSISRIDLIELFINYGMIHELFLAILDRNPSFDYE